MINGCTSRRKLDPGFLKDDGKLVTITFQERCRKTIRTRYTISGWSHVCSVSASPIHASKHVVARQNSLRFYDCDKMASLRQCGTETKTKRKKSFSPSARQKSHYTILLLVISDQITSHLLTPKNTSHASESAELFFHTTRFRPHTFSDRDG